MSKFLNNISLEAGNDIQFKTTAGSNAGKIEQVGDNLVLSNAVGDVLLGDGASDVYIGDGTNNVDIVFEQSGSIRGDGSAITLTLGGSNTTLNLENPNVNGNLSLGSKLTLSTSNGYILFDYEPTTAGGEYTSEVPLLRVDRSGSELTVLSRLTNNGAIALGNDDTVAIIAGDTKGVIKDNIDYAGEKVVFAAEGGFHAYGFPSNDTTWSNRNEFRFRSDSGTASENGLYIGDGGNTQFIDLSRNLKNIGTISSGAITSSGSVTATSFVKSGGTTNQFLKANGNVDGTAYAPLASPALTGTPTAPTAAANTNTTQIATTAYVQTELSDLIGGAPTALDTLNELAAAINDDSAFSSTVTTALGNRLRIDINNQGLTSTQQGYGRTNLGLGTAATFASTAFATAAQGTSAETAYGWGNHASAGYLTGNQTITLSGDVSGSGTTSINVTVANDSHTHDGRYFTETESDARFLGINAQATDSDKLDGQHGSYYLGAKGQNQNYVASSTSTSNRGNYGAGVWAYSGYSSGSDRPFTYDATLQVMPTSGLGFEISTDWHSSAGQLKIRSLRDCCQGWSDYTTIWTSANFANNSSNWNTAYGWGNHASAGYLTTSAAASTYSVIAGSTSLTTAGALTVDQLNMRDAGDYITFYGDDAANHSIGARNASGNADDDIRINSYGSVYINLDSNNNNSSLADFRIGRHGSTGTISDWLFTVDGQNGNVTVAGTVDGRDLASDGSKLDGIASGADVTPSWVPSTNPNYLTGNQTITLSGDVSGSGTTSISVSLANDSVGAAEIAANAVGASELNVSGNGTTAQFLRSDGDGTFTWATPTDTNTTYSAGTGLSLSSTTFNLDAATSTVKGGVELFSDTVQSVAANAVSATASRTYGIQLNSAGQAVVNVPWVDTNTTYNLGSFGITATAGELNTLDGITATTTELNYTDGVTSNIQTQLNARLADSSNGTISGARNFTGTFSLGGTTITATAAELNYTDGVTSNIQTQLNGKQASGTYNTIIGTDSDINTSGSTIIDNIYVTDGVITSMGTRTLTASDISALTQSTYEDIHWKQTGRIFTPQCTPLFYNSSGTAGTLAAVCFSRTEVTTTGSAWAQACLNRTITNEISWSGGGIEFAREIGVSFKCGFLASGTTAQSIRYMVGGRANSVQAAGSDPLVSRGFGVEIRSRTGTTLEWRVIAHNGTSFTGGTWTDIPSNATSVYTKELYIYSDGSGNIEAGIDDRGGDGSSWTTKSITGGPTANGNSTYPYICHEVVNAASGSSYARARVYDYKVFSE